MKFLHIADTHLDAPFTVLNTKDKLRRKKTFRTKKSFAKDYFLYSRKSDSLSLYLRRLI